MENKEKQFINGFNSGYTLAKYEPQLLNNLLTENNPVTSYIDGMKHGKIEFEKEHLQTRLEELSALRRKDPELDRDIEK